MARERITDDASQLPRGRHGLTHGAVVEHQRQRMIRAVPSAVREKGFVALTVEDISARAGVSRRTFYENFRDKEDCFMTSYRQHAQELVAVVGGAAAAGSDWHERTRFGLRAMLRHLAERPDLVYMAVIEVNAAGPAALAVRDEAVGLLAALIGDEAFVTAPEPAPRLLLRTIGGSILQLIYASVLAGRDRELEELLPTIIYIVLVAIDGPQDAAIRAGLLSARTGSETG